MIMRRVALRFLLICIVAVCMPESALAHGGVVQDGDLCVIKVNYLTAHFKIYQPRVAGHEQFCEDLPVAAESVFVMEYQHDALASMPIDFRIIRDVTGKGRFAQMQDVEKIDDLDGVTVFYQAATIEPDVFTVIHEFVEEGKFIGIVTVSRPDSAQVYAAVFPFEVGFTGIGYWPFFLVFFLLVELQYLFSSGWLKSWWRRNRKGAGGTAACALLLLLPFDTYAEDLIVTYTTPAGTPEINRMHSWILHIENASGVTVEGALIEVVGGMPEHNHGLPTLPRVTAELGDGDYKLEGMRFHMSGYWEIVFTITTDEGTSIVTMPLQL
jgi:hypothetical protein